MRNKKDLINLYHVHRKQNPIRAGQIKAELKYEHQMTPEALKQLDTPDIFNMLQDICGGKK